MKTIYTILLILWVNYSFAQWNWKDSIDFDLGFGTYYQFSTFGSTNFNQAKLPRTLSRRGDLPTVQQNWGLLNNDRITDNPFFHGSYFFELGAQAEPVKGLTLSAAIIAEQRGFSDGRFSKNTLNIFPYFNASFTRKKGKFAYLFQAGDFYDLKAYEGLTFYNLQTQSWVFKLSYDKFYFKHMGIGDLLRSIGLGIDDLYDYSIGAEELQLHKDKNWKLDARMGYSNNRGSFGIGFWNFSLKLSLNDNLKTYAQYSIGRRAENAGAFLLGLAFPKKIAKHFSWEGRVEYRRYSSNFNRGYRNITFYRNPDDNAGFVNSTNRYFFPLSFFERPFSQWAVFTEYQNEKVSGLSFYTNFHLRLFSRFFIKTSLDFNLITTNRENFLYPFYAFGLGSKPIEEIEIFLEITNRVLNLDKHFPTLYASKSIYFLIRAYKPLSLRKKNDQMHRNPI